MKATGLRCMYCRLNESHWPALFDCLGRSSFLADEEPNKAGGRVCSVREWQGMDTCFV
jgi:hypothetical protein